MINWWHHSNYEGRKPDQDWGKASVRFHGAKASIREALWRNERRAKWPCFHFLATVTTIDIDIHFPESYFKSDKETWVTWLRISFLLGIGQKSCNQESYSRWLKTVSSTVHDVDFDGSLLPPFINWCYNHNIKKLQSHRWTRYIDDHSSLSSLTQYKYELFHIYCISFHPLLEIWT